MAPLVIFFHLVHNISDTMSTSRPRRTASSPNNGNSIPNPPRDSSTPLVRSGNNVITPATANSTNNRKRRSASNVPPQRRSTRSQIDAVGEEATKLPVPPNHYFTSKYSTCLKFGLIPSNLTHRKVICRGCMYVVETAPHGILTEDIIHAPRAAIIKQCSQPWDPKYANHTEDGKRTAYEDFHNLFEHEPECSLSNFVLQRNQ
jgi:hypothetical protein